MSIYIEDKNGKRRKFAGVGSEKDYIDDGIASEKMTWSSEKILDTLCPPFTETGNPITCNPVEGYPLSAVVTLKPKQAGTGDPSPDNVRPISGYDSVTVNVRGKNLLSDENFQSSVKNGITFTKMGNGVVHIEGTASAPADSKTVYDVPQLPPRKYVGVLDSNIQVVVKKASTGQIVWYNPSKVIIEPGDVIQYYYFAVVSGSSLNKDDYIFLVPGESPCQASDFEPYQPGTTSTLTLPETIYGGTVDAVTGVGEKTWGYIASYDGESLPGEWISDRDVYSAGTTPTTGAQVAYKLATPEPFQATGNRPLSALPGTNTLYTDGNSLTVSGSTSPISAIESFKADVQASANQAETVANILLGGA